MLLCVQSVSAIQLHFLGCAGLNSFRLCILQRWTEIGDDELAQLQSSEEEERGWGKKRKYSRVRNWIISKDLKLRLKCTHGNSCERIVLHQQLS